MKKIQWRPIVGWLLVAVLAVAIPYVYATTIDDDMTFTGTVTMESTVTIPTGGVSAGEIANVVRYIQLPLMSFLFEDTAAPLSTSTTPGLELDDSVPAVVWADGETSQIGITFRVPADYASGGAFKVVATDSDADASPLAVDFLVYTVTEGTQTAGGTNQTAVALSASVGPTPDEVTLTPATDFAALAAGDYIHFQLWRDNVLLGASDLEVKGAAFYYTATQ